MAEAHTLGEVDLLTDELLADLAADVEGPCASIFVPMHRAGPETRQNPTRLRNAVDRVEQQLADDGASARDAAALVAPARRLLDDPEFFQHQADGLAVYLNDGSMRTVRVPLALDDEIILGSQFALRPLLPLISGDGSFLILALSQNSVRLFSATRQTVAELPRGSIPADIDEANAIDENRRQLQMRSVGDAAHFHGHGLGDEVDKEALERFLRAVDAGLEEQIGADRRPLIIAGVSYYLPFFKQISDHPHIVDTAVEGNPDVRSAAELHAAAWSIVEPIFDAGRKAAVDRYHESEGTGSTAADVPGVVLAALDGQVDTLFVAAERPEWGRVDPQARTVERHDERQNGDDDLVERAVGATLRRSGAVYVDNDAGVGADPLAALLRW